jgi:predicted permease
MSWWQWWKQWRGREEAIDEEIRAHLAMAVRDRVERGELPEDAERAARREFGNELLIKEVTREMWGWVAVERFVEDLSYVFRQMRRSPGFTAIALITLALGLGATTAMFSLVNGVLLEPMKFPEPGRLYEVQTIVAPRFKANRPWPVNARHFYEWRTHGQSWEQIALIDGLDLTLTGSGEPQRLAGLAVSYNFFRTLGVQPAEGRDFLAGEELPGHSNVVILADSLWRTRFAADPSIVGRTIELSGEPNLVIGVMPPAFRLPWGTPGIFRPLGFDVSQARAYGMYNFESVMRLKPGVQPQQAVAEMNALIADLVRRYHIESKPGLAPLLDRTTAGVRSALWLLLGAVGTVLLIVCVNIGNLMLLRTSSRHREAGVRMALGASRWQLFGIVLQEAVVLVAIGGGIGLLLAHVGLKAFTATAPVSLPRLDEVYMDWRVLIFSLAAMGLSTLICGFVPAWRLSKIEPLESLKTGSANATELGRRLRLREAMVGLEVALSTVLLIVGGLLMVSFVRVLGADKGFDVAHVIAQDFALTNSKYTNARRARFIREALPRLGSLPGVDIASVTNQAPLLGENAVCGLRDPDHLLDPAHPDAASNFAGLANYQFVGPDFWRAMGIPMKNGRGLEERDQERKVAVVSERVARTLWPDTNPIGRRVMSCGSIQSATLEVIGVAGDVRTSAEQDPPLTVYQPYWDLPMVGGSFVIRTRANPATVIGGLHRVLRSIDSDLPIAPARTMQQTLDESVRARRFEMYLAVAFAAVALLLASLGIYGVVSFAVARRTPEIGLRMALGARPAQLVAMVLRQGMVPVVTGLVAGLFCSLSIGSYLASQLFGISPRDPLTIGAVTILLLAVAAGACFMPSRRAIGVDPVRALRFE